MKRVAPPDVRAVMIAIGEQYQQMVELTAPRVERFTGLPVEVILDGDPFVQKLSLLDGATKPVLFVDADAVMLGWDWRVFHLDKFNAALDVMTEGWPGRQAILSVLPQPWAINSGVWLAPPSCAEAFARARELKEGELKGFQYALGDQTPLNLALQQTNTPMRFIPRRFNKLLFPHPHMRPRVPADTYVAHLVGGGNHHVGQSTNELDVRLERVRRLCERYR